MAKSFDLKAIISAVDKLSPTLLKINRNLAKTQRQLQAFGKGGIAMGATLATGLGLATKAFAQNETAAADLNSAMLKSGGQVSANFGKITALAEKLGNKLPGTTADLTGMMTMLIRQGMSETAILNGLGEATALLAAQLKMPYEAAAEFSAKLQDATQTTEKDMLSLMDVIQRTFYLGVDSGNMLQGFAKLSPALATLKMSGLAAAQTLAPLLVMADQAGMAGEAAGNAYRKVFQLAMDAKKVGKANDLLSPLGMQLDFTNGKGEFGGIQKLFHQLEKLGKLTTQQRLSILKTVFGDDAETLQVLSLMADKGMAGYQAVLQKMGAQAALQDRVNIQLGTVAAKWEAATGTATNMLAAIGETFAPEMKDTIDNLGKLAEKAGAWVKENPKTVRTLIAMAGALTGVKLAALAASYGFTALRFAFVSSPLGLAVTALALAAGYVIANWDKVKPYFEALWKWMSDGWQGMKTDIEKTLAFFEPMWAWMKNGWQAMQTDIEKTAEFFKNAWKAAADFVTGLWDKIMAKWEAMQARLHPNKAPVIPGAAAGNPLGNRPGFTPGRMPGIPADVDKLAEMASLKTGVEAALIKAVIAAESGGNAKATNSVGAMGLMQLMPGTAKRFGVTDAYDPYQNVMAGAAYLRVLLKRYSGNYEKAIAAYNAGEGNVDKYGGIPPFAETRKYVPKVMDYLKRQRMSGSLDININGAPQGTRVKPKPGDGLALNTKVGYRSLGHAYG